MSAQQTESISQAAQRAWRGSLTSLSYTEYVLECKARGLFWGCDETLMIYHQETIEGAA